MVVIIPTNDWISVAPDIDSATGFRLMLIRNGSVIMEKLISVGDKKPSELLSQLDQGFQLPVNDQDRTLISVNTSDKVKSFLQEFRFFNPSGINIINAVNQYIREARNYESDFCCQP
jgi:hypothetical protein